MSIGIWLIVLCSAFVVAMIATSLIYRYSGIWERMDKSSTHAVRERIHLTQFGFFVLGERVVVGGHQNFFGICIGQTLWLRRKDFGILSLTHQGFPERVARLVQGQVIAKYKFTLSIDGNVLAGNFTPFKVEFSVEPAAIKSITHQPNIRREYRRVETIVEKEIAVVTPSEQ